MHKIKKAEFFTSNINIEKTYWFYLDKFEDVSIYYFKNEYIQQQQKQLFQASATSLTAKETAMPASSSNTNNFASSQANSNHHFKQRSSIISSVDQELTNLNEIHLAFNIPNESGFYLPQKNESFNNKLKLWKCCTLIKHQNITVEKILNRIKNERLPFWLLFLLKWIILPKRLIIKIIIDTYGTKTSRKAKWSRVLTRKRTCIGMWLRLCLRIHRVTFSRFDTNRFNSLTIRLWFWLALQCNKSQAIS